jgi:hypothetical protein
MAGNDKKEREREGKRDTDDRDVCNNEEKEVPGAILISLHMFYSTYSSTYSSNQNLGSRFRTSEPSKRTMIVQFSRSVIFTVNMILKIFFGNFPV